MSNEVRTITLPMPLRLGTVNCCLLESTGEPALGSIMDDVAAGRASLEKLRGLGVRTVFPGHGRPFDLEALS